MRRNAEMAFCLLLFLYWPGLGRSRARITAAPISYMGIKNRHLLRGDDFYIISVHRINQR